MLISNISSILNSNNLIHFFVQKICDINKLSSIIFRGFNSDLKTPIMVSFKLKLNLDISHN